MVNKDLEECSHDLLEGTDCPRMLQKNDEEPKKMWQTGWGGDIYSVPVIHQTAYISNLITDSRSHITTATSLADGLFE